MAGLDRVDRRELAPDRIVEGQHDRLADQRRGALQDRPADAADVEVLGDEDPDPGEVRPDPEAAWLVGRGEEAQAGHLVQDPVRRAARDLGRSGELANAPLALAREGLEDADPARHRAAPGGSGRAVRCR